MAISGFTELLPRHKLIEQRIIDIIRSVYASYGFCQVDTPCVELYENLIDNGVPTKEMYVLRRAQDDSDGTDGAKLGLRFDLTVPFARYLCDNLNDLHFPFKRYSLGKVFRGERPQKGRSREFYQMDIDIVSRGELPLAADAEVINIMGKIFDKLNIAKFEIAVNNRKILNGFYRTAGVPEDKLCETIAIFDKIDKISKDELIASLCNYLSADTAKAIHSAITSAQSPNELIAYAEQFGLEPNQELFQGINEWEELSKLLNANYKNGSLVYQATLARGLGYYTGTIFEITLPEHKDFGSASGGGRYENLTTKFIKEAMPAVGGAIGITRLMHLIVDKGLIEAFKVSEASHCIIVPDKEARSASNMLAEKLRDQGVSVDLYLKDAKFNKQLDYAQKLGFKEVLFYRLQKEEFGQELCFDSDRTIYVRDLATGDERTTSFRNL